MRQGYWLGAGLLLVVGASRADAQGGAPIIGQNISPSNILGGASPSQIQFTPPDLTRSVVPLSSLAAPVPPMNMTDATQSRFSFSKFFRRLGFFSSTPDLGVSPLPPPTAFPGANYPSAFQPVAPVIP